MLQLRLGDGPQGHPPVARGAEELQRLAHILLLPRDLPHGLGVLPSLGRGLEHRPIHLVPHVENYRAAVVKPRCQQRGVLRVEVQAHYPGGKSSS